MISMSETTLKRGGADTSEGHFGRSRKIAAVNGDRRADRAAGRREALDAGEHAELAIAGERACAGSDGDETAGDAGGNERSEVRVGDDGIGCGSSVKRDCGGFLQTLAEDFDGISDGAPPVHESGVGLESGVEAVEDAATISTTIDFIAVAAGDGVSVEDAVGVLNQRSFGDPAGGEAERVKDGIFALGRDLEDGAITAAAAGGGSVEVAVCALDQAGNGSAAISTVLHIAEVIEDGQFAGGREFVDNATEVVGVKVGSAAAGGSVEVAVGALNHASDRVGAIVALADRAKDIEDFVLALRGDAEDDSGVFEAVADGSSNGGGSVEIAIVAEKERVVRIRAVGLIEGVEDFKRAGRSDSIDDSATAVAIGAFGADAVGGSCAVKIAVKTQNRRREGLAAVGSVGAAEDVAVIGLFAGGGDLEDGSGVEVFAFGGAPEIAIECEGEAAEGAIAVGASVEAMQHGHLSFGGDLKDGAIDGAAAARRGTVQIAVASLGDDAGITRSYGITRGGGEVVEHSVGLGVECDGTGDEKDDEQCETLEPLNVLGLHDFLLAEDVWRDRTGGIAQGVRSIRQSFLGSVKRLKLYHRMQSKTEKVKDCESDRGRANPGLARPLRVSPMIKVRLR